MIVQETTQIYKSIHIQQNHSKIQFQSQFYYFFAFQQVPSEQSNPFVSIGHLFITDSWRFDKVKLMFSVSILIISIKYESFILRQIVKTTKNYLTIVDTLKVEIRLMIEIFFTYICSIIHCQLMSKQINKQKNQENTYCLKKCKVHREANSYGMPLSYISKCECCAKFTEKQALNINFPLIKIYYSGAQVPSYLTILKYLIFLFLIISLINALPLTIINHKGKCCEKEIKCSSSIMLHFSVFNMFDHHKKIKVEAYITFVSYLVCLIFWQILRLSLRKIKNEIDQRLLFPSPFAVFCELPTKKVEKSLFLNALENWWKLQLKHNKQKLSDIFPQFFLEASNLSNFNKFDRNYKRKSVPSLKAQRPTYQLIQSIYFSYNQDELGQHQNNIKELTQKMQNNRSRLSLSRFRQQLLKKRDQLEKQVRKNNYCLVIFKKLKYAQYFLSKTIFNNLQKFTCLENIRPLILHQQVVPVEGNLYPSEIYWKNHHLSHDEKKTQLLKIIGAFFLLLVGSIGLTFLSCFMHKKTLNQQQARYIYLLVNGIVVNSYIVISSHIIGKRTQAYQLTTYSRVKITKIVFISLFNIILLFVLPFCIFYLLNVNYLWGDSGLLESLTITFLLFMIFSLLKRYLAPINLSNFNKKRILKKGEININQKQANQISAKTPHYIDEQYISVLTVVCTDLFLSPFCPYITIFSSIWFILHYFLERINIAFFYSQDQYHSSILSQKVTQWIQKCFSFIIFGSIITYFISVQYFSHSISAQMVFFYILFGLIIIITTLFPFQKLTTNLMNRLQKSESNQKKEDDQIYKQSIKKMNSLYENYNQSLVLNILANEQNLEDRLNATEQMHTIQASLTISLKQRLLMNMQAIPKNGDNMSQSDDVYFEYEKKVFMNKFIPKVHIPPLFKNIKELKMSEGNIGRCLFPRQGSKLQTE